MPHSEMPVSVMVFRYLFFALQFTFYGVMYITNLNHRHERPQTVRAWAVTHLCALRWRARKDACNQLACRRLEEAALWALEGSTWAARLGREEGVGLETAQGHRGPDQRHHRRYSRRLASLLHADGWCSSSGSISIVPRCGSANNTDCTSQGQDKTQTKGDHRGAHRFLLPIHPSVHTHITPPHIRGWRAE